MREKFGKFIELLGIKGKFRQTDDRYSVNVFDDEFGMDALAEVRSYGNDTLEAEIQLIDQNADNSDFEVLILFSFKAVLDKAGDYKAVYCSVEEEDYTNKCADWPERACKFFKASIEIKEKGEMPDFQELINKYLVVDDKTMNDSARGGGKSAKIRRDMIFDSKPPGF